MVEKYIKTKKYYFNHKKKLSLCEYVVLFKIKMNDSDEFCFFNYNLVIYQN